MKRLTDAQYHAAELVEAGRVWQWQSGQWHTPRGAPRRDVFDRLLVEGVIGLAAPDQWGYRSAFVVATGLGLPSDALYAREVAT